MLVNLVINGASHAINCESFEIISVDGKAQDPGMHGVEMLRFWFKGGRGRMTDLAAHLGLSKAVFAGWRQIPRAHVPAISEFTGIKASVLRPEFFEEG